VERVEAAGVAVTASGVGTRSMRRLSGLRATATAYVGAGGTKREPRPELLKARFAIWRIESPTRTHSRRATCRKNAVEALAMGGKWD
jgi:hypothetical protein